MDAIDELTRVQFDVAQRYDLMVTFVQPTSAAALQEVRRLPGVLARRAVPGGRRPAAGRSAVAQRGDPRRVRTARSSIASWMPTRGPLDLPGEGLVLSDALAALLDVDRGDRVTVELLEGNRAVHQVVVAEVVARVHGRERVHVAAGAPPA